MSASRTRAVLALAGKDLRLLSRNRATLFFALGWPILMALFFGYVFGGGGEKGQIPVVVVDEDRTAESERLIARLTATTGLAITSAPREEATRLVRQGKRSAAVIVPKGYGEAADRLFHGAPRRLELEVDPARTAEGSMLEGILTGAAMQSMQELFTDPARTLGHGRPVHRRDLGSAPASPDRDSHPEVPGRAAQLRRSSSSRLRRAVAPAGARAGSHSRSSGARSARRRSGLARHSTSPSRRASSGASSGARWASPSPSSPSGPAGRCCGSRPRRSPAST